MSKLRWPVRAMLFSCLGLFLCLAAPAQTIKMSKAPEKKKATLEGRIAEISKVKEEDVAKVLKALGPVVTERVKNGDTIEIPSLGTFRVVRVEEHKDLVNGRPAKIAARNYVEFVPSGGMNDAANSETAVPSTSVPGFEYVPIGNRAKEMRTENSRQPNTRTR